jgi:hypothetical protein
MVPWHTVQEERLEEHAAMRIAVVVEKILDGCGGVHSGIVAVEAELVVGLKWKEKK